MTRTTGVLTGTQYTKLVDIRLGFHPVRPDTLAVGSLVTRGLVVIVDGRPVVTDTAAALAAEAEYESRAQASNARFLASLGVVR